MTNLSSNSLGKRAALVCAHILACSAITAHAHPGHSLTDATTQHLLTSPYHLIILTLLGGGLVIGSRYVHQRIPRVAMQALGSTALVATALLLGLGY